MTPKPFRNLTPHHLALWAALPMARAPRMEGRLSLILDRTRSRHVPARRAVLTALGLSAAALLPLAMLRPVARAQAAPVVPPGSLRAQPDTPARAVARLQRLYSLLGVYRRTHGGAYPATVGPHSLIGDIGADPVRYGLPNRGAGNRAQAVALVTSPGSPYVDCFLHSRRPDGTPVGAAKRAGTRDVLAYSSEFVGNAAAQKIGLPSFSTWEGGFYSVLWDDGTVQRIPASRLLAVPAYDLISDEPGATERARREGGRQIAFPGQAGLPKG
jgi:hypothetical protein